MVKRYNPSIRKNCWDGEWQYNPVIIEDEHGEFVSISDFNKIVLETQNEQPVKDPMSCKFFQNTKCEYFPCKPIASLNCMFCYCPLYSIKDCGGTPIYLSNGIKDCSSCIRPHLEGWLGLCSQHTC